MIAHFINRQEYGYTLQCTIQGYRILPRRGRTVTPAEAGVQRQSLDSGFLRNDDTAQTSPDLLAAFLLARDVIALMHHLKFLKMR